MNVNGLRRNIKNIAHNYTDAQVKVREATSNDPWGPPASLMSEISDLTYNRVAFSEIMQMIWKRLNDHGKNYRHVYKALVLLDYLVKTGNEKVAQQCKENIFAIHTLRDFQHYEEGKDQGINVREKAKQLESLLNDEERLKNERVKALKARERFAQQTTGFGIATDSNFTGSRSESFGSDSMGMRSRPAAAPSDLDLARPQTAGEEELQLQLALAMSREEAEKEDERRRSDDVRLALAMAQSNAEDAASGDDRRQPALQQPPAQPQTHLLDLLDVNITTGTASGWVDPWGTPAHPSEPPAPVMPPRPKPRSEFMTPAALPVSDAWGLAAPTPTAAAAAAAATVASTSPAAVDPWGAATPSAAAGVASNANLGASPVVVVDPWAPAPAKPAAAALPAVSDPWSPQPPARTAASSNDPWSPASPDMDGFDLLTTRAAPAGDAATLGANGSSSSPFDLAAMDAVLTPASTGAKPKKSPETFLGPNSNLVNLENLVPTKTSVVPTANPFALTPAGGGVGAAGQPNPFQQPPAPRPSINELRHQQNFGTTPLLPQQPLPQQLQQPQPQQQQQAMASAWGSPVMMQSGGVQSPTFNPFLA